MAANLRQWHLAEHLIFKMATNTLGAKLHVGSPFDSKWPPKHGGGARNIQYGIMGTPHFRAEAFHWARFCNE